MFGIVLGTSFRELEIAREGDEERVVTPYGSCTLQIQGAVAYLARHGEHGVLPPHRINHHAHFFAFKTLGIDHVVSFGSVGSLRRAVPPGTLIVPYDIFAPFHVVTYHNDEIKFTVPEFDQYWRDRVIEALEKAELNPVKAGIYVEAMGPRFETHAEIRFFASVGDIVGMTCAAEAALARELNFSHAIVNMVDNYANGVGLRPLTGERFREQVAANRQKVLAALDAIIHFI